MAREVYNSAVERVGADAVALITGEEKIKPPNPRFWVATVEAMPRDLDVAFLAIDEIQLAADFDRGHVFTDRMLHRRGREETLVLGAATMRPMVERLLPGASIVSRPRLSQLTFAGEKKITRLPRRSAIVAFSAEEVYAIAELIRRQRGGAAVVLGALSPRTRNAQVALYQAGEVDYLVATDAIGMGLNLDVDHVAFASDRKFDGYQFRKLNPAELAQIAGRAGRATRDGTFGTTGRCPPFETELAQALETHTFEPVKIVQWRNTELDFSSIGALQATLAATPTENALTRAPVAEDILVLDHAARDDDVRAMTRSRRRCRAAVGSLPGPRLSQDRAGHACRAGGHALRLPHARGRDPDRLVRRAGGAGRPHRRRHRYALQPHRAYPDLDLRGQPAGLAGRSGALAGRHARRRGQAVRRAARAADRALRRSPHQRADAAAARECAARARDQQDRRGRGRGPRHRPPRRIRVRRRTPRRADRRPRRCRTPRRRRSPARSTRAPRGSREAPDEQFVLAADGTVRWTGAAVGKLVAGEEVLAPRVRVIADEHLSGAPREAVQARLDRLAQDRISKSCSARCSSLPPRAEITGIARGVAFQLVEALGVLDRGSASPRR